MSGRTIPALLGEGVEIPRNWAAAHLLVCGVSLGTVMVSVGVSFGLLMCYNGCKFQEVNASAILDSFGSNQRVLCPWARPLLHRGPLLLLPPCFTRMCSGCSCLLKRPAPCLQGVVVQSLSHVQLFATS